MEAVTPKFLKDATLDEIMIELGERHFTDEFVMIVATKTHDSPEIDMEIVYSCNLTAAILCQRAAIDMTESLPSFNYEEEEEECEDTEDDD